MRALSGRSPFGWGTRQLGLYSTLVALAGFSTVASGTAATTDIFWRNSSTGANSLWLMQGSPCNLQGCAAYASSVALPTEPTVAWRAVATGDFNGDGHTDVVWRHYGTGQNVLWYMNGPAYVTWVSFQACTDLNWEIVGTGDFNGDGHLDLLWRDAHLSGGNVVWYMNNTTYLGWTYIQSQTDLNWRIVGTGDFNGDGHRDILWRHQVTGQNAIWYMNGTSYVSSATINPCADTTWEIVGTGSFNADGLLDILWRNRVSGANVVWFMNNAAQIGSTYLDGQSDLNWKIAGTGEFNEGGPPPSDSDGDGLPDAWELPYFGNLSQTAAGDYDGDGLTNLQEYQGGTNPTLHDFPGTVPLPSGAVSWWSAQDNALDSLGNNPGTLAGNVGYLPGRVGQGFGLDGSGDGVGLSTGVSLRLQDFTVEGWIRRSSGSIVTYTGGTAGLVCYGWAGYGFGIWQDGRLFLTKVGIDSVSSTMGFTDTAWHHVAVTKTGTTVIFYMDGVANAAPAYTSTFTFNSDIAIGARGDNLDASFFGLMDEFAVYNRALSAPEIQAIASARGSGKRLEVAAPIISPYGGVFTGSVSVTLSTSTSGATIRYTTNGSEPTSGSTLYTAPFLLTQNATVKAKAFKSGMADSVTTTSAPFVLLGRGPVGWWKLDEGDGSVAFDSSGGGHTGTLLNGPAWINGRVGAGALSFDGANDSVTVPDQADLRLGTNLTLACWFKKQGEPGDRTRLVGKGNSTSRNYNVWEEAGADKRILFQIYMTSGAYLNLYSTVNLEVGVWYHVGCTYDGATARIYINGTPAGQLTMSGVTPRTSNHPVTFGYAGFHTYLNGALDDVRLYDRALTAAEMADLAAAWQQPIVIIPSLWVNTTTISGTVEGRLPAGMAFLVNSEDFASATWEAFHSPFSVNLGPGDGARDVWIGFMDFSGVQTWQKHQVILDTTPPVLTLTEPLSGTTSQPFVQVKGSANEPLTAVTFDLVNGNGTLSDEPGLLLGETYDENAFLQEPPEGEAPPPQPIAWPFQLFDVELADGANALTLRATDRAGNTATVPLNYTLDLTTDHTAPVITLHWPQNNAQLATDTFDLRGQLDDPCATVTVTGLTAEPVAGLVERNGLFWVEGLPLAPGINTLTVVATDAAGNARSQALTLTRATALTVTISEPTEEQLAAPLVTVFGTITDNQHDVWVNGVRVPAAALIPEGGVYAWQADSVPLGDGGTAVIQARAIPVGAPHGAPPPFDPVSLGNPAAEQARDAQRQWDRPARTYVGRYFEVCWHLIPRCEQTRTEFTYMTVRWGSEDGRRHLITRDPTYGTSETLQLWPAYTDEGIGIGCLPPAGDCPECMPEGYAYWWALPPEHCAVTDLQMGSCLRPDVYIRSADTTMVLNTGGKALRKRRNLFAIYAAAYALNSPRTVPPYPDAVQRMHLMTPVDPPTPVKVLGASVGSDGYLFVALPDGIEVDVTPRAAGRFYYFDVLATKHSLVLTADGHDLAEETPEFCVGVKVDFSARFAPPLPEGSLNTASALWVLPAKFVNEAWQATPTGSLNYRRNDALLHLTGDPPWQTFCWYVNRPGVNQPVGIVQLGAGLHLANGQYVVVTGKGEISIYRPEQPQLIDDPPATVHVVPRGGTTYLQLATEGDTESMDFTIRFVSRYAGRSDILQLVRREYVSGADSDGTHGAYWLDKYCFYTSKHSDPDLAKPVTPNSPRSLIFSDAPEIQCLHHFGWTRTSIDDDFKYYVMFRPDAGGPTENIYVSLGKGTWSWKAYTDWSGGAWSPPQGTNVVRPTPPDATDDFPEWPNLYSGQE